ncbi:Nuclease SbcCD subunit C [Clavibacter michiganensis subsp. michiganensis]|uniref:AAA family ATPase n=1 Tax=Clavibacter michiganensis TaxID=28447 RepID=UPI000B6DCC03|nr:AAA family ATPase [Clavibacter michiganensis]OUE05717.1 Nuclease SbcCD subunit C [Clavibacter michiganensis subsp. michiganensis]
MDLHRLTLQAIGPFAGEHVIDFAELGRSGLFLLEGPTGSGKSTLIDAVVFALYGSLASEGSSRDRLHSHHAAPGVEPYVELVFETAAGIHRVRRSPQHQRPKARGTGTTNQNAAATLVRLSSPDADAGEVIGTSTQEVGTEVARIVGLTRAQFVQTVVLPQGEFAEFLRSTGEQRRLVLQSLFGTAVYERTAAQLGEMRKAAKARTDAADAKVAEALTGLREATRVDALEIADAPDTVRLLAELADAAETARADEERTRQGAATALADAERVSRALDRRRALIAREEAVRTAAEEIDPASRGRARGAGGADPRGPGCPRRALGRRDDRRAPRGGAAAAEDPRARGRAGRGAGGRRPVPGVRRGRPPASRAERARASGRRRDREAAGGALRAAEAAVVAHDAETERIRTHRDDARAALSGLRERVIRARELLTEDEAAVRAALADRDAAPPAPRRRRAHRSSSALARHDAARRESARAGDQARAAIRMAEVANAITPENTRGTTLGTYVLLRRFEDVVQAANARLRIMSSGRYELEVSEEREATSRSRKTGLALQIRDHVVDRVREPASFSGGETFYASLALALGLADVVQAEAGGLQLGTLFVDEGFGTLDPETLDAVMSELGRLSSGGRTVGIVSHVEELKQRVADRIEVRRRADGSSTLTSTVADPA